jgi:hypothetical protein
MAPADEVKDHSLLESRLDVEGCRIEFAHSHRLGVLLVTGITKVFYMPWEIHKYSFNVIARQHVSKAYDCCCLDILLSLSQSIFSLMRCKAAHAQLLRRNLTPEDAV